MAHVSPNYEINVAKRHPATTPQHYCRIELGFMSERKAKEMLEELKEKFGEEFVLSLTYWYCAGTQIA